MGRPITLFTGQWADLPLEDVARKASEFGYQGLELACWGDHFEVDKALADDGYCAGRRDLLERYDLQVHAISTHLVGQAVLDPIDARHKAILPPHVWGDGKPAGVNARAAEELKNTARAAQKLGVGVVNGFTGSSIWHLLYSFPPVPQAMIDAGFELLAERFNPILDVFGECGVQFALEVHPTEIAFDLYTAERALAALDRREEFGFNFDPSHLLWQGVDPVEFIRAFPDRIYHVHVKDAIVTLNGRTRHPGQPPDLWRSAPRLGLPLAGPRRRQLRRDHPRAQPDRATTARCRSNGKTSAWTARPAPARRPNSSNGSTSSPASVAFDAAFAEK